VPTRSTDSLEIVPPYTRYATVYDRTGQTEFSVRAWPYVRGALEKLGWSGDRVLDLACGTGAALAVMARDGYHAWGADLSREMLLAARLRTERALTCADFRALPLADRAFDLVTSFYDSVNYLPTLDDLARALSEVHRVLRPGGVFVFDLNTRFTLREHWEGLCHARVTDDVATIWEATWDETSGVSSLRATFFVRGEDGRWDRFVETHDERGFKNGELEEAFKTAGFELLLAEDYHARRKPSRESRRVFYFLRRRRGR
jgi:SAM-dependent methyltransferase